MTPVFSGMIIECEIMGSRGLAPLQGRSEEGAEPPSFFLLPWNIKKIPPLKRHGRPMSCYAITTVSSSAEDRVSR